MRKWAIASITLAFVGLACSSGSTKPGTDGGGGGASGHGGSGGTHNEGGGTDAPKDSGNATAACASYATAFCMGLMQCSAVAIRENYHGIAACEAAEKMNCINELAAAGTGDSPATKTACAAAIGGWSCPDFINGQNIPAACVRKTGSVASGGACAFDSQCSTGSCQLTPKSFCGTCATPSMAGGSCMPGCAQGLVCQNMKCTAIATTSGATCGADTPCGYGLDCVGADPTTMTTGTCMASVSTLGGTCDFALKTGPGCDLAKGLTCEAATKKCKDVIFALGGEPCGVVKPDGGAEQKVLCQNGANCTASPGMPGDCQAPVLKHGTCKLAGRPCPTLQRCVDTGTRSDGGELLTCEVASASTCK